MRENRRKSNRSRAVGTPTATKIDKFWLAQIVCGLFSVVVNQRWIKQVQLWDACGVSSVVPFEMEMKKVFFRFGFQVEMKSTATAMSGMKYHQTRRCWRGIHNGPDNFQRHRTLTNRIYNFVSSQTWVLHSSQHRAYIDRSNESLSVKYSLPIKRTSPDIVNKICCQSIRLNITNETFFNVVGYKYWSISFNFQTLFAFA